jgi:hypothetical protein
LDLTLGELRVYGSDRLIERQHLEPAITQRLGEKIVQEKFYALGFLEVRLAERADLGSAELGRESIAATRSAFASLTPKGAFAQNTLTVEDPPTARRAALRHDRSFIQSQCKPA